MFSSYTYRHYDPSNVVAKYIGFIGEAFTMFEVNSKNQTIKSYPINRDQVEVAFADRALELKDMQFNQVKIWER